VAVGVKLEKQPDNLFEESLNIVNVGLEGFAQELASQSIPVTQLDWRPPAEGDAELAELLSKLGS
jgi:hypothetical protein